ncbi:MAG: flotillin [Gemmatimonadota bacterium]|nr:MAG: flotillin [Gemmatimonadota bacterium]
MALTNLVVLIAAIIVVLILIILAFAKQYKKVGPNEVLIISGGRKRTIVEPDGTKLKIGYRMHIGGGTFVMPLIERAQILPLEVLTVTIKTPEVLTAQGVHIIAEAAAQVKVGSDEHAIRMAAEQFLATGTQGIKEVSFHILEGRMRATIGASTVEQIYKNREEFNNKVMEESSDDFARMGLTILSFALKDISDAQGYLESLGKPRIAQVRAEAAVAEAEANKEATIKAAHARKEGDIVKFQAEADIAAASRDYEIKRAEFQAAINQKKAQADLTYEIERHRMNQQLKKEEYRVRLIEKEEAIKVEERESLRKEQELEATVKKAADAKKYQIQTESEAESYKLEQEAKGRAVAKKLEGDAEAEAMRKKAEAWAQYNQAAIYEMLVEKLPELARAVSEPLSKVDKIVIVGGGQDGSLGASKISGEVARVLAQLPPIIETLGGVDLKKLVEKLPELKTQKSQEEKGSSGIPESNT